VRAAAAAVPGTSVGVVLVSHDTREELLGALASLAADTASALHLDIVVVDTGSVDGTAHAVAAAWPEVRVLQLVNTGFARAANAGMRVTRGWAVVVANADVRFEPGAVDALVGALARDPALAAVGPAVRYPDGTLQASARRRPGTVTAVAHALLGRWLPENRWTVHYHGRDLDPDLPRDVDWLSGCALVFRRAAIEPLGGFDPGYFLYVEDVDLAERLRAAGWRLRYEPAARVRHRVGASTGQARWSSLRHHARSLNRYLAARMSGPVRMLRPLLPPVLLAWAVVTAVAERCGRGRSTTGERQHGGSDHDRRR